ncbi:MAG: alpha/beta fold hydrolase [Clostridia bacterium]|nr:alpha/beta fold hydrolase [Clostridia bacterium]
MKKRLLCMFLTVVLAAAGMTPALAASDKTPTVVVSGYSSCQLYYHYGKADQEQVWPFAAKDAVTETVKDAPNAVYSLACLALGNGEPAGKAISGGGQRILKKMFCDPNGNSLYDVTTYPNDPAISNYAYMKENAPDDIEEPVLCEALAEKIGEENVFVFHYDFRMSSYDCAANLNKFINAICRYTGSKKVNVFGFSYGGLVVGIYLSRYKKTAPVNNVVLNVPVLGGTSFARRFIEGDAQFPVGSLAGLFEFGLDSESNLSGALQGVSLRKIEQIANAFLTDISVLPLNWGSFWDLTTPEDYNELKPQYLDSQKNAELIRKSDIVHGYMKNYVGTFRTLKNRGAKISIICNYVDYSAFGGDVLNDMLVDARSASGAVTPKVGERFADDYKPVYKTCKNHAHSHVAPSRKIDATSAYLPENTWFVDGQYHGMYTKEPYSFNLVLLLLTTKKAVDIYTDKAYPQFNYSRAAYRAVTADFNGCKPCYVAAGSNLLTITNPSTDKNILITGVEMDGFAFRLPKDRLLKPGQSMTVPCSGKLPKGHTLLKVSYIKPTVGKSVTAREFDIVPAK